MAFDITGARNEGYTDDEILNYLKSTRKTFDFDGALKEGYSTGEVVDYLSGIDEKPQLQEEPLRPEFKAETVTSNLLGTRPGKQLGPEKEHPASYPERIAKGLAAGASYIPQAAGILEKAGGAVFEQFNDPLIQKVGKIDKRLGQLVIDASKGFRDWLDVPDDLDKSKTKQYTSQISEAVGMNLPWLAAGVATKNKQVPLIGMSLTSAALKADEVYEKTGSAKKAVLAGVGQGITEYATELMPMDELFRNAPFAKSALKYVAKEIGGEEAAMVIESAIDKLATGKQITWKELWNQVLDTAVVAGVSGGVQSGVVKTANYMIEKAAENQLIADEAAREIRNRQLKNKNQPVTIKVTQEILEQTAKEIRKAKGKKQPRINREQRRQELVEGMYIGPEKPLLPTEEIVRLLAHNKVIPNYSSVANYLRSQKYDVTDGDIRNILSDYSLMMSKPRPPMRTPTEITPPTIPTQRPPEKPSGGGGMPERIIPSQKGIVAPAVLTQPTEIPTQSTNLSTGQITPAQTNVGLTPAGSVAFGQKLPKYLASIGINIENLGLDAKGAHMLNNLMDANYFEIEKQKRIFDQPITEFKDKNGKVISSRKVISNEQTIKEAAELIASGKVNINWLNSLEPGTTLNAAQQMAARSLVVDYARLIQEKISDPNISQDEIMADMQRLARTTINAGATASEAGRALQQQKINVGKSRVSILAAVEQSQGLRDFFDKIKQYELTPQLIDLINTIGTDNPGLLVKLADNMANLVEENPSLTKVKKSTFMDKVHGWIIRSMLGSGLTQIASYGSNVAKGIIDFGITRPLIAGVEHTKSKITGKTPEITIQEAFKDAARYFTLLRTTKMGLTEFKESFLYGKQTIPVTGKFEDVKQQITRLTPKSTLQRFYDMQLDSLWAQDAAFSGMAYQIDLLSRAERKATREGKKGETWVDRVQTLIEDEELIKQAAQTGRQATFNEDMNQFYAQTIHNLRQVPIAGWWFKTFVMPFTKIAGNVARYSYRWSPYAIPQNLWTAATSKNSLEQSEAVARILAATATTAAIVPMFLNGMITGGSPKTKEEREQWDAIGKQEYSFKIGGSYYSYKKYEPLATLIGVHADFLQNLLYYKTKNQSIPAHIINSGIAAFSQNFLNKSYMDGLSKFVEAMNIKNPDEVMRNFNNYLKQTAPAIIPGHVRDIAIALNRQPMNRKVATTAVQKILEKIPFTVNQLENQPDIFGRDLKRIVYYSKAIPDKVVEEMIRLQVAPKTLNRTITTKMNQKVYEAELTDKEYVSYLKQFGPKLYQSLMITANNKMDDVKKRIEMKKRISEWRVMVKKRILQNKEVQSRFKQVESRRLVDVMEELDKEEQKGGD